MFLDFMESVGYKVVGGALGATCPSCGCEFEIETRFFDHATKKSQKEGFGKTETKKSRPGKKARAGFKVDRHQGNTIK